MKARLRGVLYGTAGVVLFVLLWKAVGAFGWVNPETLPDPFAVPAAFVQEWSSGRLLPAIASSLVHYFWGLGMGTLLGIVWGLAAATVHRFAGQPGLRVPHMGWNRLKRRRDHPLMAGLGEDDWAYFVHSYAVPIGDHALASADYGGEFACVIAQGNFHGMQFHPERSAKVGARLLKNFLEL